MTLLRSELTLFPQSPLVKAGEIIILSPGERGGQGERVMLMEKANG